MYNNEENVPLLMNAVKKILGKKMSKHTVFIM